MKQTLLTFALFLAALTAGAQTTFTTGGLTYKVTDAAAKTVEIIYYNGVNNSDNATGYTGDIVIPQSVSNDGVTYSVTAVAEYAFEYSGITSVTIPAWVTTLKSRAFSGCKSLASVRFENSSEKLTIQSGYYGAFAWSGNGMSVYVDREMTLSDSGSPFYEGNVASVEIGANVAAVTPYLFYGVSSVVSVGYSSNAKTTEIGAYAFYGCKSLSRLSLPASVTTIGDYAFREAGNADDVESMSVTLSGGLTTIGSYAFYNCTHLKNITLPAGLTTIKDYAFNYAGLTSVTIPASVTSVESRAFSDCKSLASVRFEYSSEKLTMQSGYYGAFAWAGNGMSVYVDREMTLSDSNSPFYEGNVASVEIGSNVTAVTPYLFYGVSSVASVGYSSNAKATEIGAYAFYGCKSLSRLSLPTSVTTIGDYAFREAGNADGVESMSVTLGRGLTTIGSNAFYNCTHLKNITLPAGLTTIRNYAFDYSGLTSVTIPSSVTSVESRAFSDCKSLASVRFEYSSEKLTIQSGYYGAFAWSGNGMSVYVDRELTLSDSNSPFYEGNVASVEIGANVATVSPYLFYNVLGVASVGYSSNAKATEIGAYAFYGCKSLSRLSLPASVTTIGDNAFREAGNADNVESMSITLGSGLTTIGSNAFYNCTHLKNITLPAGLTTIKSYAFEYSGLTSVTIPASVTSLESRAFGDCRSLTSTRIADGDTPLSVVSGYYGSFNYSDSNTNVYIGRDITMNDNSSPFAYATDVEFGPQVTTLQPYQMNTDKLMNVKAPWAVPFAIADNVFHNNTYQNGTLWVHSGNREAYAETDGWKNFTNVDFQTYYITLTATKGGTIAAGDISTSDGSARSLFGNGTDVVLTLTPAEGYQLTALKVNGEAVTVTDNTYTIESLSGDMTVEATFAPIVYTITYDLTGGTLPEDMENPATYTVESGTITLANPVREGYAFTGWTGTDLKSATMTVTIEAGSTGNREYAATWKSTERDPCDVNGDGSVDVADIAKIISRMAELARKMKIDIEY